MTSTDRSRRIRVIWNPNSGSKGGIPTNSCSLDQMQDLMARHGLGDDLAETASEEDARARAREAVDAGYDMVVAAGGDGTVGTVARELLGTRAALGILPLGSVMNVARMLGVPRDLDEAAGILVDGEVRAVDVGEANGTTFFEAGSVGMNAAMFREAQRFDEGAYGSVFKTIWVALRYRPARMLVHLDHETVSTRALMVAVANGPYTGLGLTVAPDARLDDGVFDVAVFRHYSRWELFRHLGSIAFGRRRYSPRVSTYRSAKVSIESRRPLPTRADSHDLGTTPVEFVTHHGVLRVVAPRDPARR